MILGPSAYDKRGAESPKENEAKKSKLDSTSASNMEVYVVEPHNQLLAFDLATTTAQLEKKNAKIGKLKAENEQLRKECSELRQLNTTLQTSEF